MDVLISKENKMESDKKCIKCEHNRPVVRMQVGTKMEDNSFHVYSDCEDDTRYLCFQCWQKVSAWVEGRAREIY